MTHALSPIILVLQLLLHSTALAQTVELEEQARRIASELRCPVCQNLSVADSPSEMAQQMRALILEQLRDGKSPDEIKAYFTSRYGEWVLLAPPTRGFSILVWVLPFMGLAGGFLFALWTVRRWVQRSRTRSAAPGTAPASTLSGGETARELAAQKRKIGDDLEELEFDHQAGKLSEQDYQDLKRLYENQAVEIQTRLGNLPVEIPEEDREPVKESRATPARSAAERAPSPFRRSWVLAGAAVFLLIFGIVLGFSLSGSIRPRTSEQESITGNFLTGTSESRDLPVLLNQGRRAFEGQNWPAAIAAFKKALAIDPDLPEAHSYMGWILLQAGHVDGALLAFDRALAGAPDYALALWGKGMLLYRAKNDLSGARESLERLHELIPPGKERAEVEKILAEIQAQKGSPAEKSRTAAIDPATKRIQGTISLDERLRTRAAGESVLFIIARSTNGSSGPPLAVKRIERPLFPLSYSLGGQDVMIPGSPFQGKIWISVRLDQDGNAMTRSPGDLSGEYRNNPAEVGTRNVDIVIDRVL